MKKILFAFTIISLFAIASATRADSISALWEHGKPLTRSNTLPLKNPTDVLFFLSSLEKIAKLNAEYPTAKFGLNQFADLTNAEYKAKYAAGTLPEPINSEDIIEIPVNGDLPESVDWRSKGAVTSVKDQGACGSCWAFSVAGLLEAFYFINNGKLLSFSEQQIVDCAKTAGFGCFGGYPRLALNYVANNRIELEDDYPYTAKIQKCQYDASKAIKVNSGGQFITPKSSEQLKAALVNGPVSVIVDTDDDVFMHYKSGVITSGCGVNENHAVLAVGYEKVDGIEAFIVKNSYGTSWGQDGYVWISTDESINDGFGACSILSRPLIAV